MNDQYIEFAMRGAPTEWHDYACDLFDAAVVLSDLNEERITVVSDHIRGIEMRPSHSRTVMLLFALSIENILKGHLVAENPQYISNGALSREVTGGRHSLVALTEKIQGFSFSEDDIDAFQTLESSIPSWGRYPIPKRHGDIDLEVIATTEFVQRIERIFRRLGRALYMMLRDGWEGPHQIRLQSASWSMYENDGVE